MIIKQCLGKLSRKGGEYLKEEKWADNGKIDYLCENP